MIAHPQHGVAVRKMFDPNADLFSKEIIARKERDANVPGMARMLQAGHTPVGTPTHINEYVPGTEVQISDLQQDPALYKQYLASMTAAQRASKQVGETRRDLRASKGPKQRVMLLGLLTVKSNSLTVCR